ncbi:MAG: hypothetical protein IJN50_07040 [Clostridia bacterium]|nr:hypothetical protein [Clostridia bacterium]
MFRLKQFYNQNRKKIWVGIIVFIFLFGLLQLLNYLSKNKVNTKDISNSSTNSTTITATKDKTQKKQTSVMNDYIISDNTANLNEEIIKKFIEYCNNGETAKAYELLSNNCKDVLYSTEEAFIENYYKNIFNEKKICDMQVWTVDGTTYTYKVTIASDILSTGQANNSNQQTDYITVIQEDDEKKLNINSYICRKNVKGTSTQNNIQLTVNYKDVYMEYEKYNISIKNKSQNIILLDNKENVKTIYLLDDNDVKYSAYAHEISKVQLVFKPQQKRTLDIKFNKVYDAEKVIKNMHFTSVIINYEEYVNDKENYEGIKHIIVDL